MNRNDLANRFRSIRQKENISQKEFAQKLGVSQGVVADIERGAKEPSRAVLVAIAKEYHVSLDWLLLGIEAAPSPQITPGSEAMLLIEIETLKKENARLEAEIRKVETEYQSLDVKNRAVSEELLERMRQLVDVQNRQLGVT
jgi:transcriptional regulator with XRE-family HTH domain